MALVVLATKGFHLFFIRFGPVVGHVVVVAIFILMALVLVYVTASIVVVAAAIIAVDVNKAKNILI